MNWQTNGTETRASHEAHVAKMVDYYARTAENYNEWHYDPDDNSNHNQAVGTVLQLLKKSPGSRLLDICCGTGRALRAALQEGHDVHGIDISAEMLQIAEREFKIPAERLRCGDATRLPYPDESFDIACVLGALHHCALPEAIVTEMSRVARKTIVISDAGDCFAGGVRSILKRLGLFKPIYWLIFRRAPRTHRRACESLEDGPGFDFSSEEILPLVRQNFSQVKCIAFYQIFGRNISSYWLPRLFARHLVIIATGKRKMGSK